MKNRTSKIKADTKKRVIASLAAIIALASICSCSSNKALEDSISGGSGINNSFSQSNPAENMSTIKQDANNVEIDEIVEDAMPDVDDGVSDGEVPSTGFTENGFIKVEEQPQSFLSADVDTVSYSLFRYYVNNGYSLKQLGDVTNNYYYLHTEEMINYFSYEYDKPQNGELFGFNASVAPCPWNKDTLLLRLGLKADDAIEGKGNNLVFLIDVSGSMRSQNKLPLIKKSFSYLVDNLTENDTVSIVTYAGDSRIVLEGCKGNQKTEIMNAINSLSSGGSTYGERGLLQAYDIARSCFIEGGNNRIILASDGDFNVGVSSTDGMLELVNQQRMAGLYMSVLCYGEPYGLNLHIMEAIANNGNGVYYYIDSESEAERVFAGELSSMLYTVASDVKMQISFSNCISEYRLIGYENRLISSEDFENDAKDAAEVGAGHNLTVLYEIKLAETDYSSVEGDWLKLSIRYKPVGDFESKLEEYKVNKENYTDNPDSDFIFISCLARVTMLVHDSKYNGNDNIDDIYDTLRKLTLSDSYKKEFVLLIETLRSNSQ